LVRITRNDELTIQFFSTIFGSKIPFSTISLREFSLKTFKAASVVPPFEATSLSIRLDFYQNY
jgi:hypothetical protein